VARVTRRTLCVVGRLPRRAAADTFPPVRRRRRRLFLLATTALLGCIISPQKPPEVVHPDGYEQLFSAGQRTRLTPQDRTRLAAGAWTSKAWKTPGDGLVEMQILAYAGDRNLSSFEFDVEFELRSDGRSLMCSTRSTDPSTRLECRSEDEGVPVVYRMAAQTERCSEWALIQASDRGLLDCWDGELVTPTTRYTVEFSYVASWDYPVPRIVWREPSGRALQSSEPAEPKRLPFVVIGYKPERSDADADGPMFRDALDIRRLGASSVSDETLQLNALAIHVWLNLLTQARDRMHRVEFGAWSKP